MRASALFAAALLLDLAGGAGALLISTRDWQTITTRRPAPRPADVLQLTGRTVDAAPTALALVALAGVVAVLATRGSVRRVVGALLLVDGLTLAWRAAAASAAVSTGRARDLVLSRHETVNVAGVVPHVATHAVWAVLTAAGAIFVTVAGALTGWRGHRWPEMSARYERRETADGAADGAQVGAADGAQVGADANPTRAAAALWTALDRGDDPTAG